MTYRQLADYVKQRQRLYGRAMRKADDDWMPEFYVDTGREVSRQDIPPELFTDRRSKRLMVNGLLIPFARRVGARRFAFVTSVYMLPPGHPTNQLITERIDAGDMAPTSGLPRFQDTEGAVEFVCVLVVDAERDEFWQAKIHRPKRGSPTLGAWGMLGGPGELEGEIVEPLREAIR